MTITHDPRHAAYLEEADVRNELSRVFDVCGGCRRCTDLCGAFPTLFGLLDQQSDGDAGRLTPAEQDAVVDECRHCKLCAVGCPYAPDRDDAAVDIPRTMVRATAMRVTSDRAASRPRRGPVAVRIGRLGSMGAGVAAVVNRVAGAPADSIARRALARTTGISARRLLPSVASQRFSAWFRRRLRVTVERPQGVVSVFPGCLVEYHEPSIGHALVKVYERNGVQCELTGAGCCGAPWLHAGEMERFLDAAERNVEVLAGEIRDGRHVVVAQPTCAYVLRREYPRYLPGGDTDLVAANAFDASEYLMLLHEGDETVLDTNFEPFSGDPPTIAYHASCHVQALEIGLRSRELLGLTGARVTVVRACSGTDGGWGLQAANEEAALGTAADLAERIAATGGEPIAGDCHMANTAIVEQTGREVRHPLQVLARAYGIPPEP